MPTKAELEDEIENLLARNGRQQNMIETLREKNAAVVQQVIETALRDAVVFGWCPQVRRSLLKMKLGVDIPPIWQVEWRSWRPFSNSWGEWYWDECLVTNLDEAIRRCDDSYQASVNTVQRTGGIADQYRVIEFGRQDMRSRVAHKAGH